MQKYRHIFVGVLLFLPVLAVLGVGAHTISADTALITIAIVYGALFIGAKD